MPRTLPPVYRRMAFAQDSDDGTIVLLTIDHADLSEPLRFVADHVSVTSNGDTYLPAKVAVTPPQPVAGTSYTPSSLTVSTVDQSVTAALRSVTTPISVNMQEVMISDPDEVVATYDFTMRGQHPYNQASLVAPLTFEPVLEEPMPPKRMSPALAPGLFGG